jgi:O-succinylbenzoate synthase
MRIERAVLREIRLRLRQPFRSSRGMIEERRVVLVTLEGGGCEGWGECVAGVDASSPETADTAWGELSALLRGVPGGDVTRPGDLLGASDAGRRMARAAVEMAAWDLLARARARSLSAELGGTAASIPVGVSVGLQRSAAELIEAVTTHLADGYARVKVKIEPGRDVEMLRALRACFPRARLWADANAAYTLADLPRLREIADLGVELLEQPLAVDDLAGHARLQRELATMICLDESIACEADARRAVELRACRAVNLKPGRAGGHGESLRIHDLLRAEGVHLWCGGMLESGVGRAHNVALASLPGFTLPGDISASRRYWERDVVKPAFDVEGGRLRVPTAPGIGVQVDRDHVAALTTREVVFELGPHAPAGRMHQGQ